MIAIAGLAALFLSGGIVATYHAAPKIESRKLEITAIDVGQGDSLLVVSPEGRTMLIDGGGSIGPVRSEFDFGEDVVAPYLWSRGLGHLDVVALTHAHGDHIGGLPRIIEDFHPSELWVGINPKTPALMHLYEIANQNHLAIRQQVAGDELDWSGTHIRVLSPPADWQPKTQPKNDDSLALLISYGNTRALLAGDLEKNMERFVATESPAADLLKVRASWQRNFYNSGVAGSGASALRCDLSRISKSIRASAKSSAGPAASGGGPHLSHRLAGRNNISAGWKERGSARSTSIKAFAPFNFLFSLP